MDTTPQQPAESQDSILAALHNLFQGAQQNPNDYASLFNGALNANTAETPPTPMPVPGGTNPYGGMAAVFAAALADQMGAHGALAHTQGQLNQNEADRASAMHENHAREQAFNDKKAMERMGILMKIGEAKAEALSKQGDLDKYEAQVKANLTLANNARSLQEQVDQRKAEAEHKYRMEEIIAAKKVTPEDKKAAADAKAQDLEDKAILKFQEDISNVAKKPGSVAKQKEGGFTIAGFTLGGTDINKLTPAAVAQIRGRAAVTARSAGSPRLKQTALETLVDTYRNPTTGAIDTTSPTFHTQVDPVMKALFPDPQAREDWMKSMGII